ncbi:MAG: tetratricopeptide repeat protein, partial [Bdellovibrionota bacterium]
MKNLRAIVLVSVLSFIASACSATLPIKKEPNKAPANAAKELRSAEALLRAKDYKKALPRLKKLALENPESDISDDAHFLLAETYAAQNNSKEAVANYKSVTDAESASPLEAKARVHLVRLYLKDGLIEQAAAERKLLARMREIPEDTKVDALVVEYEVLNAQKELLAAMIPLVAAAEQHPNPAERTKFRQRALDYMDSKLTEDELETIASSAKYGFLQPIAKYRYGIVSAEQKEFSRARSLFE